MIKHTLDPTWKPFEVSSVLLCNGDYDRPLKVGGAETRSKWSMAGRVFLDLAIGIELPSGVVSASD